MLNYEFWGALCVPRNFRAKKPHSSGGRGTAVTLAMDLMLMQAGRKYGGVLAGLV
jgi:hypothetical protein